MCQEAGKQMKRKWVGRGVQGKRTLWWGEMSRDRHSETKPGDGSSADWPKADTTARWAGKEGGGCSPVIQIRCLPAARSPSARNEKTY